MPEAIPQIDPVVVTTNAKMGIKLEPVLVRLSVAVSHEHTDTYIAWQVAQPLSRSAGSNVHWKEKIPILVPIGARNYGWGRANCGASGLRAGGLDSQNSRVVMEANDGDKIWCELNPLLTLPPLNNFTSRTSQAAH